MIQLDQSYYGRDPNKGYRLLATSNPSHNSVVERLCGGVGTPDGNSTIDPFYINYIENGYRYMISGCIGNPDDNERKTLFFHAFVGHHQDLLQAGFGIADLIKGNYFHNEYKTGPVLPIKLNATSFSLPWGKTAIVWDKSDLAIRSAKPELSIITGLLKSEIDDVSWASFSFQPLNSFKLYVISEYVAFPQDRKSISTTGDVQFVPKNKNLPTPLHPKQKSISEKITQTETKRSSLFAPFIISLLVNFVLIGVLFYCWGRTPDIIHTSSNLNETPKCDKESNTLSNTETMENNPVTHNRDATNNHDNHTDDSLLKKTEETKNASTMILPTESAVSPEETHPVEEVLPSTQETKEETTTVSPEVTIPSITREDIILELRDSFEKEYPFAHQSTSEWKSGIEKDQALKSLKTRDSYKKLFELLHTAEMYIQFVNTTLFNEQEEN